MNKKRKLLSLILCAGIVASAFPSSETGATSESIAFYNLKKSILEMKEYDELYDTNHNGVVNVFDVIRENKEVFHEESYTDLKSQIHSLETQIEILTQKLTEKEDKTQVESDVSIINSVLTGKIDQQDGKQLSSNDYTDEEKQKLESLNNYDDTQIKSELSELSDELSGKVDKEEGKQLSSNDYTDKEKQKLESLNNYDDSGIKSDLQNQNQLINSLVDIANEEKNKYDNLITNIESEKVDKEEGKQLSSNDYTDEEKQKLENLNNYDDSGIKSEINEIKSDLSYSKDYAKLHMADEYTLVVDDGFELFWKSIIEAYDPYVYNIDVECSVGNCYKRKYDYLPRTSGTYPMRVTIKDNQGNVLDTANTVLNVVDKVSSPSTQKNVLCVGDSILQDGEWARESYRRLTGVGGNPIGLGLNNISFIGTCKIDEIGYEGYGGYSFADFNQESIFARFVWISTDHNKTSLDQHSIYQDSNGARWKIESIETDRIKMIREPDCSTVMPSSGTLTHVSGGSNYDDIVYSSVENTSGNPFWNTATNKVDFKNYANSLGVNEIDYCYVLLGGNSTDVPTSTYREQVKTFINNLLSDFPNCKIGLMSTIIPCQDGCGANYGCSWNWYSKAQILWNMFDMYSEIADEYENVHYINVAGQFDGENNFPIGQRQVNIRNTTLETYQINGFHPSQSGNYQIADVVYRDLNRMLQNN